MEHGKLSNFISEIECGYHDSNPYHNRTHATSVFHSMHALLQLGGVGSMVAPLFGHGGVERLACWIAAAVHDYDDLALTNDMVKSGHDRATRYNDMHVNESHHAAAAFAFCSTRNATSCPCCPALPNASLVSQMVLSTDMADHVSLLKSFNECVDRNIVAGSAAHRREPALSQARFAPNSEEEATRVLTFAMKCSDLGPLSIDWDLHTWWVSVLEDVFFLQGDQESALAMPVSFLMDRSKPGPSS